ncbi:MAG: GYD domain-containing protein [Chloroflexota bacterium]
MATYVTLIKFTSEGPKNLASFGKQWEAAAQRVRAMGVKALGAYGILGPYDMMFIYEAPDQRTAAGVALSISYLGADVQTETWGTIPLEEFVTLPEALEGKGP